MTCVYMCLYKTTFITKSTSGQVHYQVHKWTSSSHGDALKLFKSTNGQVHYQVHKWMSSSHGDALKLSSPQVDEFVIKFTSGRVHPMGMP